MTYLETAKAHIERIDGEHPAEFIRTMSLASIANSLIEIAENVRAERTCHNTWDVELTGRLRFACSECGGVSLEIAARYCPICGAKVVDE